MAQTKRHEAILELLKESGSVTVEYLTKILNASPATIRRDLEKLEKKNCLRRTYGGAIGFSQIGYEPSYNDRMQNCLQEKQSIARVAAGFVKAGDIVAIDSGTTTTHVARLLTDIEPLTVVTPSLNIAVILSEHDKSEQTIIVPGGMVRSKTLSLVGPITEETLLRYHCDKAIIGCLSITPEQGVMNSSLLAEGTKKALVAISNQVIVVADHTKFQKTGLITTIPAERIDILITSTQTPKSTLQKFRDLGIEVLVAD